MKKDMEENLAEQVDKFKERTGFSHEMIDSITSSRHHKGGIGFESESELKDEALKLLTQDSTAEQIEKVTLATGLFGDDIAGILQDTGVDVIDTLELMVTQAVSLDIHTSQSHLGQEDVVEALKGTGLKIATAASLLADKLEGERRGGRTEEAVEQVTSFVERYKAEKESNDRSR